MEAIMKTCTMDACDNPLLAKGLCRKHYLRKYRTGKPEGVRPNGPLEERFWPKVNKRGPDDCWEWQASRTPRGYGQIGLGGNAKPIPAHRASYMLAHGRIPDGMHVLHSCDNPACVNPAHLRLGTHAENMRDKVERGRVPKSEFICRGEGNINAKLNADLVRKARSGELSVDEVIEMTGVNRSTVNAAKRGKTWKHI
jgi:hypothetical protein